MIVSSFFVIMSTGCDNVNFYMKYIYPIIVGRILNHKELKDHRIKKLDVINEKDKVLEIGFGDGQNLNYYPKHVKEIDAIDINSIHREKSKNIKVNFSKSSAENLPFNNNTYDYVISCFTLCSIKEIGNAIKEIKRVLKPGGKFLFLEHGKSPDKDIFDRQMKYNKYFIKFGDGCHLDRNIEEIVKKEFKVVELNKSYCKGMIKSVSYIYDGEAIK